MKVYEMISYLQTFNPDAEVKFLVQEDFTTKVDVVKKVLFNDEYGYDCETEEQNVDVSFDQTYTELNDIIANKDEVIFAMEV